MKILVTGATGFIGRRLMQALLQPDPNNADCELVAAVRNPARLQQQFPDAHAVKLDAAHCSPAALQNVLQGVDVVINTIGVIHESSAGQFQQLHVDFPVCLAKACQQAEVRRLIHISALGAEASAPSAYHQSKYTADEQLQALDLGVDLVILKPSLVYGQGGASSQLFAALAAQPVQLLIDHGQHEVQPIHIDDLVTAVIRLCDLEATDLTTPLELELVGPTPMTFRDMLLQYRRWLGEGRLRAFSLPWSVVLPISRVIGRSNRWLTHDNMLMLRQGNTGDAQAITKLLGRPPRALYDMLPADGATQTERWHARLLPMVPLLRWSLAFVWIYTGLVSLFIYPPAESYALLARVGLHGDPAVFALYSAALLDIALGIALLLRWRPSLTGFVQLAVIITYTLLISIFLPEYWLHPYGPLSKNFPMLAAILILMAVDKDRR